MIACRPAGPCTTVHLKHILKLLSIRLSRQTRRPFILELDNARWSRDHLIRHRPFPTGGALERILYLIGFRDIQWRMYVQTD